VVAAGRVAVALKEKMAPYWWIIFSQTWYLATLWGLREGYWVYGEEETIFRIPVHKRTKDEDRPRATNHDKKIE
jgi:hypothetical protein